MFSTTLQVEQQEKETEKIRLELQAMTEESHKLMRRKQQLQQQVSTTGMTIPLEGGVAYS